MNEFECIECGCLFNVQMVHEDSEDEVIYCVNCGSELGDRLDENLFEDEDDL